MGDIRNKLNKIVQAQRDKAALGAFLRHGGNYKPPRTERQKPAYCRCGLSFYETKLWQCGRDGLCCLVCMPLRWKQELIAHYLRAGIPFNSNEHGED